MWFDVEDPDQAENAVPFEHRVPEPWGTYDHDLPAPAKTLREHSRSRE